MISTCWEQAEEALQSPGLLGVSVPHCLLSLSRSVYTVRWDLRLWWQILTNNPAQGYCQASGSGSAGRVRREEEAIRVIIIRLTPLLSTYLYLTSFYSKSISKFYQIALILNNKMYTLSTKQFVHVLKLGLLDKHFTSIATTKGSKSSAKRFYDIYLF